MDELKGNNKFYNSVEYIDKINKWLIDYCNEWKEFLDSPKSWNEDIHQIFKNEKSFELDKGWFEDSSNWKSFNQFFSRKLKLGVRHIEGMDDDSIVITPVHSLPQGIWNINKEGIFEAEPINEDNGVALKSKTFMNIE